MWADLFFSAKGGKAPSVPLGFVQNSARFMSHAELWNFSGRLGVWSPRAIEENHDA